MSDRICIHCGAPFYQGRCSKNCQARDDSPLQEYCEVGHRRQECGCPGNSHWAASAEPAQPPRHRSGLDIPDAPYVSRGGFFNDNDSQ